MRGMHRITQHSDSADGDLDGVFVDEWADARRGAGGDDVAGKERHHARDPADKKRAGIDHQRSAAGLAKVAVNARFDDDVGGIEFGFDVRADRAEGVEAFGARELDVGFLEVACGDVVGAGVAEDVGERVVVVTEMRAGLADDDGEFAYVLDALRIFREDDGVAGSDDGRGRLEEDHRLFRDFVAEFGGVGSVIAADADDFARSDRRNEFYVGERVRCGAARERGPRNCG